MSILLPYQSLRSKDNSKFIIDLKARQIGFSFEAAYTSLKRAVLEKRNQLIVSASQRQASRVMIYIEKFFRAFKKLPSCSNLKFVKDAATTKELSNGAMILSLPPSPETIRGFDGDIILDEFSLYKNDNKVYEAILPSILRGYSIRIIGTPLGCNNKFYQIWNNTDNKYPDFKRNSINIYEAIAQGLKVDIEEIKRNYDEDSFRQEFMCEFIDDSSSYFPYELIRNCIDDYGEIQGVNYMGIDIGRTHDRTVIFVVTKYNEHLYESRKQVLDKMPFDQQKEIIKQIYHETKCERVRVDKGAIGYQLAEELEKEINAEGIMMTAPEKVDICTLAKKYMEQKKLHLKDDREVITDIHSIQKIISQTNDIKFNSPRDSSGHGDRAWALFEAIKASQTGDFKMGFVE